MKRAQHLVAALLDEAYTPDYSEPSGRNYAAEREAIKSELAAERQQELKKQEREVGMDTEREMRAAGEHLDHPEFSGTSRARAKSYFEHPGRRRFSKMKEVKVGQVTQPSMPPAKPAQPSFQIKGRKKWEPKNRTMPMPWTNWK